MLGAEKILIEFLTNLYNNYSYIIKVLLIIFIIYTISYIIVFYISMIKIAKKERQPISQYTIPIINWWFYFKLCRIPCWIIFFPVINVIAHFVSPIKLAYEYRYPARIGVLGVLFPHIVLPVIAFSDKKSRRDLYKSSSILQSVKSLDTIENKLESNLEEDYDSFNFAQYKKIKDEIDKTKSIDEKIKNIEENALKDDYDDVLYGQDLNEKVKAKITVEEMIKDDDYELAEVTKNQVKQEEEGVLEILDETGPIKVGMNAKEEEIEKRSALNIQDNSDYQTYEFMKNSASTIAFGGKKEVQKKAHNVTEEKHGKNRCPRCNSAIDETMDICPSCGNNLRQ